MAATGQTSILTRTVTTALLLLLCLDGCAAPEADPESREGDSSLSLRTDSTEYILHFEDPGWRTTVGFTYRAESDTVYIVQCNGTILMNLQKLEPEGWTDAWYAEGDQCLSPPIVIPPGEVFQGEAHIWGAELGTGSMNTFRLPEIDGDYRLIWHQPVHHYMAGSGIFGDTLPLAQRTSNRLILERSQADR
jgi:hypothetical protein